MAKAIRARNLGAKVTIALLAALLVVVGLVFAVQLTTTTGEGSGTPAMSADRAGGSSFARDPYVERHAEIVARHNRGTLR